MSRKPLIDAKAAEALGKITPTTRQARMRGRPDLPFVRGTVFIPRATYNRMKALASVRQTTFQGLCEEALDAWLAQQGEPPFFPADWQGWGMGSEDKDK
jgi:hypothetical protein